MVIDIKYNNANATTIFNLFNINPIDYTYLKSTNLNVIKILLVVLEKQLLKILLNASIQNQEHLIILKNAQNQLNLHKLKNLN